MACEIKDEQYGLGGAEQYYFPYLISTEHEQSVMEQSTIHNTHNYMRTEIRELNTSLAILCMQACTQGCYNTINTACLI